MEQKGYLTPFQSGKLLKGDSDGYFLGGYRVLYKIASGSFGRVYRCDDSSSGRSVAIKVLRKKWSDDKRKIDQLLRSGGPEIVLPLQQIQEMGTNDLYLLERSMHYEGKPIEIRSTINIQRELKRRTGRI